MKPARTLATLAALPLAFAITTAASAGSDDDRLTIKLSAFGADASIRGSVDGRARTDGLPVSAAFRGSEEIRGSDTRPHIQLMWRIGDRHRLTAAHYEVGQGRDYSFSESLDLSGIDRGEARGDLEGGFDIEFELANIMYEYTVFQGEGWSVGAAAGVHWARLEATSNARLDVEWEDEARSFEEGYDWSRRRWAPGIGLTARWQPADRWRLSADAQRFETRWGNFTSEDGFYERVGLNAEYRLARNIGVHAGYDWFRLKISDDFRGGLLDGEVRYSGTARAQLRVHGPTLGLTLAF